ncbi:MAG: type II toxin-antitoxin system VapC family toxin [Treponema sp.]|nr:type II toxin-antitoxin system VapC family toxin [Treponema sp.]
MSDILIHASCVLSFLLNQEGSKNVVSIVGENQLVAPSCLPFEIGNAISKLIKRKLISVYEGVSVFHEFARIPIRLIEPDIPNSIVIAGESESYAYDCYYLNIASQMVLPLFTYDDKMKETAEKRGIKCL